MPEQIYLSGKIRHVPLPVFTAPTGPDAPTMKRLLLPQGELAQFHDADQGMHYMALIELKAGGVRGNHFHRRKRESIYVISGQIEFLGEDLATGTRATLMVRGGELIAVDPNVAHALRTIEPGQAIEFSPERFDPTDTHRHPLTG
jgi:quercetin dioxygenase-like cupin family protein